MRLNSALLVLGVLGGLLLGVPLLLVGGYIWQAGLDLRSPSSSREWISLCARGREDLYCKAANRVVRREVPGPFALIYPGVTGDRDLKAALTAWKGRLPTADELEALVRANLFVGPGLKTGQMRSLDGQVWRVTCAAGELARCRVGPLEVYPHTRPGRADDGRVYLPSGRDRTQTFLPPR